MKNLKSTLIAIALSLGLLQGNAYAMNLDEYIKIESAKIEFEHNCTVDGNEWVFTTKIRDPQKAAQELTETQATSSPVTCVRPKYEYACFLPENKKIPLSGSLTYSYWSNEPTLERFKASEIGKTLHRCQGAWW